MCFLVPALNNKELKYLNTKLLHTQYIISIFILNYLTFFSEAYVDVLCTELL